MGFGKTSFEKASEMFCVRGFEVDFDKKAILFKILSMLPDSFRIRKRHRCKVVGFLA